jgi:allantoinase
MARRGRAAYKDSEKSGRVVSLALHPFIIKPPFRHKYLEKALEYIARRSDVWLTTSDDIAEHYANLSLRAN